jgi:hypothetical protein
VRATLVEAGALAERTQHHAALALAIAPGVLAEGGLVRVRDRGRVRARARVRVRVRVRDRDRARVRGTG